MNPPVDYPVQKRAEENLPASDVNFAVLRDRYENKKPISIEMISYARTQLEAAQHLPVMNRSNSPTKYQPKPVIQRLIDSIR